MHRSWCVKCWVFVYFELIKCLEIQELEFEWFDDALYGGYQTHRPLKRSYSISFFSSFHCPARVYRRLYSFVGFCVSLWFDWDFSVFVSAMHFFLCIASHFAYFIIVWTIKTFESLFVLRTKWILFFFFAFHNSQHIKVFFLLVPNTTLLDWRQYLNKDGVFFNG